MKRQLYITLVLASLVALYFLLTADWRSDHDCIRLITGQELPQAMVVKSIRGEGELFAIFFELPAEEAEALCRELPTRDGWHPLEADRLFGLGQDMREDVTGLTGCYARVDESRGGSLPYLLRLDDGKTLVAIMAAVCM